MHQITFVRIYLIVIAADFDPVPGIAEARCAKRPPWNFGRQINGDSLCAADPQF